MERLFLAFLFLLVLANSGYTVDNTVWQMLGFWSVLKLICLVAQKVKEDLEKSNK